MKRITLLLCLVLMAPAAARLEPLPQLRVAVLKYGTVSWELALIQQRGLDRKHGFRLEPVELVTNNSAAISLQGGGADLMVGDWLWVAHQAAAGRHYYFYPYSTAVGELLVPADSDIDSLQQLDGARLGVAGGAEGKSWLLMRAYTRELEGGDIDSRAEARFGAPPLLNGLVRNGQLDAILTYWHFGAALRADGFRTVISVEDMLQGLGIGRDVPVLGWVFARDWARARPELVNAFLAASYEAKSLLLTDAGWDGLRSAMRNPDDALFGILRAGYRRGIPRQSESEELDAMARMSEALGISAPPRDSFWQGFPRANYLAVDGD